MVAWTNCDWIIRYRALSNERLRAVIERPVFIVAPPRSGGTALFRSLARAPGDLQRPAPRARRHLRARAREPRVGQQPADRRRTWRRVPSRSCAGRLKGTLTDSDGNHPGLDATGLRWVDGQPRNALRVPFLAAVAPDSQFVYIHREPVRDGPRDAAGLGERQAGQLSRAARLARSAVVTAAGPRMARTGRPSAAGDRHRAVAAVDRHPARRSRGPAAGALVRDRLQGAAQRPAAASSSGICEFVGIEASEEVTRPLRSLRDQLAVSDGDDSRRGAARAGASCCRGPRSSPSAPASCSPGRSAHRARRSGQPRRTPRCGASTRRASPSSSTSCGARCSSPRTRPAS